MTPALLSIAGPTAVGKTACAVKLAQRFDGEIVGADSVQVYRGFDIGSAKPTAHELQGIRHHMIDVRDPNDPMDAMEFATLADAAIAQVQARGRLPIVVGGTGLWLRALLRGLVQLPPVDPDLRAALMAESQKHGAETMHARLQRVDPIAASRIHPNDTVRIVRALEVHEQTGNPLGELQRAHALGKPRHLSLNVFVDEPGPAHRARLEHRCDAMIQAGWVDECRQLLEQHGSEIRALGSVGYRQLCEHLLSDVPLEQTVTAIKKATWIYARRQRTWFASEPGFERTMSPQQLMAPESSDALFADLERGQDERAS